MPGPTLRDCRILVVEDEYLLADELAFELGDEGALVLGPAGSLERALELLDAQASPDGAILDVNIGGEPVFPIADMLTDRGVPFVFTTGYDASSLPKRFSHVPRCEKPINIRRITSALGRAIQG